MGAPNLYRKRQRKGIVSSRLVSSRTVSSAYATSYSPSCPVQEVKRKKTSALASKDSSKNTQYPHTCLTIPSHFSPSHHLFNQCRHLVQPSQRHLAHGAGTLCLDYPTPSRAFQDRFPFRAPSARLHGKSPALSSAAAPASTASPTSRNSTPFPRCLPAACSACQTPATTRGS